MSTENTNVATTEPAAGNPAAGPALAESIANSMAAAGEAMADFVVNRDALQSRLAILAGNVGRQTDDNPALACAHFRVAGNELRIRTMRWYQDQELTYSLYLDDCAIVDGEFIILAKDLAAIVGSLGKGLDIRLRAGDKHCAILCDAQVLRLPCASAESYPMPTADFTTDTSYTLMLSENRLRKMVGYAIEAMAQRDPREWVNGMLFEFTPPGRFRVVATDGKTLSLDEFVVSERAEGADMPDCRILVAADCIKTLFRRLEPNVGKASAVTIEFVPGGKVIRFANTAAAWSYDCRVLDGARWPQYEKLIDKASGEHERRGVSVNTASLVNCLDTLAPVIVNDEKPLAFLGVESGTVTVRALNDAGVESTADLAGQYTGEPVELCMVYDDLVAILRRSNSQSVQISFADPAGDVQINDLMGPALSLVVAVNDQLRAAKQKQAA